MLYRDMDFNVPSLNSFASPERNVASSFKECSTKIHELRLSKQKRQFGSDEDGWGTSMVNRTDDFSSPKTMVLHQGAINPLLTSNNSMVYKDDHTLQQWQISNFSSFKRAVTSTPFLKKDDDGLVERSSTLNPTTGFPCYQSLPSAAYAKSMGSSGGSSNTMMNVPLIGAARGPFTPSQRMELEQQSLIFKYISANLPVPPNLLIPLKLSSYRPYGLSASSTGLFYPNSLGWSTTLRLGYVGRTTDLEPGRCRRTDGKKWRCARDAMADQKYCERHINRGRHRSRKPVEGQTADRNPEGAAETINSKQVPPTTTTSISTSLVITNGISDASNSLVHVGLSQDDQLEGVSAIMSKNWESLLSFNEQVMENQDHYLLHHFIDDWPKDPSDWPQLSASSSSPMQEKFALFDPIQTWGTRTGLGGPLGEVLTSTSSTGSTIGSAALSSPNGV